MDYEKKYNELVGKMKKAYLYTQTDSTKAVLEDIMPELKESEDERIRKEIIKETKGSEVRLFETVTNDEFIAWLEKQAERKTPQWMIDFLDNYRRKIGCSFDYDEARDMEGKILCIKEWLEKQGKQAMEE